MADDLKLQFARLDELQRVRKNLQSYSHHDDLAAELARALQYIGGMEAKKLVIDVAIDGLDTLIAEAKDKLREALR